MELTIKMKKPVKKHSLFNPDEIVTTISRKLDLDLRRHTHEYMVDSNSKYFVDRQSKEFLKKYVFQASNQEELEKLTFQKFLDVNDHMAEFKEIITPDPSTRIQPGTSYRDKILLRARAIMHFVLGELDYDEWFQHCKHSAGSSIGVPYSNTSLERKCTFPLSVTERVKPLFDRYLAYDFRLRESMLKLNMEKYPVTGMYQIVEGSRASTVEKTDSIRRMICVEPTGNMFLQQGLMLLFYQRMEKVGLDVESLPETHKKIAARSSLTQEYATIDWSSASDCVSIGLLRWLLPPKWFDAVELIRSPITSLGGTTVELNMFSTMGNAVTFPLETLVFWTFAHATLLSSKRGLSLYPEWDSLKECSVFGDDCIVPTGIASQFIENLESVGFIINKEKSFYGNEKFRESCGGDYLAGRDVRPYNVRAPEGLRMSNMEPWLYVVLNRLLSKYILYFGNLTYLYDKATLRYIFDLFQKHKLEVKLVPEDFPDDAGLKMSHDIERLVRSYRISLSPIYSNRHGTLQFRYCNFQYRERQKKDPELRAWDWLKAAAKRNAPLPDVSQRVEQYAKRKPFYLTISSQEPSKTYSVRRKGGYVESVGHTCHWHVPGITAPGLLNRG